MTALLRHAEKQKKTEKNTKKDKNLLLLTYRPKGPNEREKMFEMMTAAEKAQSQTLRPYEEHEEKLAAAYMLAKKYGKKAETTQARKEWQEALVVVVAVDEALTNFRENLENAAKK
jgi:hypothetical protein